MDNKVEGKVLSVEPSFVNEKVELKLRYLKQLNEIRGHTITKDVTDRIVRVCDSIESDFGIKEETTSGNIVVNLHGGVDTSTLEYGLRTVGEMTAESAERIAYSLRDAAKRISQS